MQVLARALERLAQGAEVALVTVVGTSGSTPRHPGAKMIVDAHGRAEGTIGGGRVELEVSREAAAVAASGAPRLVTHHLVRDLAMCCGGSMELYIEPASRCREAVAEAVELTKARGRGVLVTDLESGEKRVRGLAPPAAPRREGAAFVEPIVPAERLVLLGCGHVGRAIGAAAAAVEFEILACDDGEGGALSEPLPWAAATVASLELADVERAAGDLGAGDYVVIATRDHAIDQRLLERLLPAEGLSYLGVIGSRGKLERFRRRLEAKGIATPERWARVRGPIGLAIGAETPAEIAVSVVAELVAVRRRGPG